MLTLLVLVIMVALFMSRPKGPGCGGDDWHGYA